MPVCACARASPRPFCQVIAGLGAPEVSQCRMTDIPSITVLSEGPAVMFGAMPARKQKHRIRRTGTGGGVGGGGRSHR